MWRWIAACVVGEALGISGVAVAYAAIDHELVASVAPLILTAGAWEGLCLGGAQALVLREAEVSPVRWTAATLFAALAGYGLSLIGDGSGGAAGAEPSATLVALLGAGLGAVMGILMGVVQFSAARNILRFLPWVFSNAIGWAAAMVVIMLAATSADRTWSLALVAAMGAMSGAVAGAIVGLATSFALPSAITRRPIFRS